ncbi:hypothetical protein HGRIS_013801 [Hohenbuehelia grisea]|uniref:Uncharacterized protein n=1 Tax=Hohenbuehelia grisea TaxID=104357 RepID=A0ABR3IWL7_9AGAR
MSSASSSGSASPSPSPEPEIAVKKSKGKEKQKHISQAGKDEGVNPNWAYQPPADAVALDHGYHFGELDYDEVKDDDDCELWLIRVPSSIKPKYLDGLSIELPPPSQSMKVGSLKRKHATYDVWSVGADDKPDLPVVGEEIRSVQCLLPCFSKDGKLFRAPKPIARHLVLSAQPVTPAPSPSGDAVAPMVYQNPPRHSYPKELLKHHFMPYGSAIGSGSGDRDEGMDVDMEAAPPPESPKAEKKTKTKKRKVEAEPPSPKKTKKAKTKVS